MPKTEEILNERGPRYGDMRVQFVVAQRIKKAIHGPVETDAPSNVPVTQNLPLTQKEALDMLATKLSRAICGDVSYSDTWHDIAGYAKLIADDIDKQNKGKQNA